MTRQLEQKGEERTKKRNMEIVLAVDGGLSAAIERSGAVLYGFSAKLSGADCLLVLRVSLAGRRQIAFVGAEDFGNALRKAVRLARTDKLAYRADKYEKQV